MSYVDLQQRMKEADFGESQLQQLFNNEFTRKLSVFNIQPIVPTLRQEKALAWDTGFYIPGIKLPDPNQKNCNLFIQYKLSVLIESQRGGQWHRWQQPYLKFKIANWKNAGHPRGNYPDFQQYNALKTLASAGYPVFYVTNQTLELAVLLDWANNDVITVNSPSLDIRLLSTQHIVATFTVASTHFFLDSDPEEVPQTTIPSIGFRNALVDTERTSFREDLTNVPQLLSKYEAFAKAYQMRRNALQLDGIESEWLLLHHTILQVFGMVWWKLLV